MHRKQSHYPSIRLIGDLQILLSLSPQGPETSVAHSEYVHPALGCQATRNR